MHANNYRKNPIVDSENIFPLARISNKTNIVDYIFICTKVLFAQKFYKFIAFIAKRLSGNCPGRLRQTSVLIILIN